MESDLSGQSRFVSLDELAAAAASAGNVLTARREM